jgi:glycosyltransferase involved in cell wall biosynthesis
MNNYLNKYNSRDAVLVLSSFPENIAGTMSAMDRYAIKKMQNISKDNKVLICAEKLSTPAPDIQKLNNILIKRIWKKGSLFSLLPLLKFILSMNKIRTVLVEFEFNVFGGIIFNIFFLGLLGILRLLGKNIVIELHQVFADLQKIKKYLNINNYFLIKILNFGLVQYYKIMSIIANSIIILEEELSARLKNISPQQHNKINLIPHHTQRHKKMNKALARKQTGLKEKDFVIMIFGYINWYKGTDWVVDAINKYQPTNVKLLIAGGKSLYNENKAFYEKYVDDILQTVRKTSNIQHTGFVYEEDIRKYFSAADLIIMPYRVFMAASGPFSLALSYDVPVILSDRLKDYCKSKDFYQSLKENKLKKEDIFFKFSKKSFVEKVNYLKGNPEKIKKIQNFSSQLKNMRSEKIIEEKLKKILFPKSKVDPIKTNEIKYSFTKGLT